MPERLTYGLLWAALLAVIIFGLPRGGLRSRLIDDSRVTPEAASLIGPLPASSSVEASLEEFTSQNDALVQRIDELEAQLTAAEQQRHARLLHEYPVPSEVIFCGERLPLEKTESYVRFEDEWNRFIVNRHWVVAWMRRSRDTFPPVEAKLAAAGLPDDLKYVMVIESAINARATSSAGAVGYWQFMRSTGKQYGLDRTAWRDDRRDLDLSTDAAIAYLKSLYEEFQSWPLAMSSYNAGERRVRVEIEGQGTSDFYSLVLPTETEAYWFRAAAVKTIFEQSASLDFHLPDDGWTPASVDTVSITVTKAQLELKEVAFATGLDYRGIKRLNPQYRTSTLPKGTHKLVLPTSVVPGLMNSLKGVQLVGRGPRLDASRSHHDHVTDVAATESTDLPSVPPR